VFCVWGIGASLMRGVRRQLVESGALLGAFASFVSLGVIGWLIQHFFAGPRTWLSWFQHVGAALASVSFVCGGAAVLARALNVVDSSHGFVTLGIPVVLSVGGVFIALVALTIGTVRAR
jgi:hypothetical protein